MFPETWFVSDNKILRFIIVIIHLLIEARIKILQFWGTGAMGFRTGERPDDMC